MRKDLIETPRPTVYFIEAVGLGRVKVGFTYKPVRRFLQIKTACPSHVRMLSVIPGHMELERQLHLEWDSRRVVGEWFEFDERERGELAWIHDIDRSFWQDFVRDCMVAGMMDVFVTKYPPPPAGDFAEMLSQMMEVQGCH